MDSQVNESGMETVHVDLGSRSYPILIGHGNLSDFGRAYAARGLGSNAAIVTNPTVARLYLDPVRIGLEAQGVAAIVVEIPDGEEFKTLATADRIFGELIRAGLDRRGCIVALGGGVVGDTAGFVAATYLRGIDFVQVPTTLEAQVDASVGGKTGVDHPLGKNMIGAFYQPKLVYVDVETLVTLPRREVVAGMAEVIKHGLIRDETLVRFLENKIEKVADLAIEPEQLVGLIARNCRIKAGVVAADETETGLREILNYGHTVGHAIEAVTDYTVYKHGEAVMLGMLAAGRIGVIKGYWKTAELQRQDSLIERIGIPSGARVLESGELIARMASDKKARDGVIRFVLPETIGRAVSCDTVKREEIEEGIRYMKRRSPDRA
ncbi:MAG: 3-dehydroquinate synthase [Gemmatimonadota bacterium]|nr:3-dehydroquinate synthase [Gemmatimonadota bacterium]